jgi:PII-like signaling protein
MLSSEPACALRIYIGEQDSFGHEPLYEAIVTKARDMNLAGATVFRGSMSFGVSDRIHTAKVLRLSDDLPVVIEIVDQREKIDAFLPYLKDVMKSGLATISMVDVVVVGREKTRA